MDGAAGGLAGLILQSADDSPDLDVYAAVAGLNAALVEAARGGAGIWFRAGLRFQWAPVWTAEVKTEAVAMLTPLKRRGGGAPRPFLDVATVLVRPYELPWRRIAPAAHEAPELVELAGGALTSGPVLVEAFDVVRRSGAPVAVKMDHGRVALYSDRRVSCRMDAGSRPGAVAVLPDESGSSCPWHVASSLTTAG